MGWSPKASLARARSHRVIFDKNQVRTGFLSSFFYVHTVHPVNSFEQHSQASPTCSSSPFSIVGVSQDKMNLRLISSVLIVTVIAQYAVAAADNDEKILDLWQEHETFSFENYVQVFGKFYDNPEEYARRRAIFEGNVAKISNHNTNHNHSYALGINQFADLLETELPMGLDKSILYATKSADSTTSRRHLRSDAYATTLHPPFSMMMDHLPSAVDWRSNISVTTAVKNQGGCGSCWAFAATAALESHIALQTGKLFDLSVQELVSCAPNPQHCGGNGGCTGSTAELAYEFVSKHGMVEEWNFAYQSFHGAKVNCTIAPQWQHNSNVDDDQSEMINGAGTFDTVIVVCMDSFSPI